MPLHAQSPELSAEVALASQLVDRGLAITEATPILQGSVSWTSSSGWLLGLAAGAELRAPGEPVVALGRVSRSWSLSGDWLAQASLLYYDYGDERRGGVSDRAEANVYLTFRDTVALGLSAVRAGVRQDSRLLGAADVDVNWPLTPHLSLTAGAGLAQTAVRSNPYGYRNAHRHRYRAGGYDRVQLYGYGNLGLAWSGGPWRLRLDRNMSSLDGRQAYGFRTPHWVATLSRAF